jgi:flagellar biogenesis protein FliO
MILRRRYPSALATGLVTGLACAAAAGPALAQKLGQAESVDIPWWRIIGSLLLCIVLAVGAAFALRTRLGANVPMFKGPGKRLQVVESVRATQQLEVCVLRFDEQDFLVASTPNGALLLGVKDAPAASLTSTESAS